MWVLLRKPRKSLCRCAMKNENKDGIAKIAGIAGGELSPCEIEFNTENTMEDKPLKGLGLDLVYLINKVPLDSEIHSQR